MLDTTYLYEHDHEGMVQYELITGGVFNDETAVDSSRGSDIHMLQSCQEEADTLIIIHTKAAHREGCERLIIPSLHVSSRWAHSDIMVDSQYEIIHMTSLWDHGELTWTHRFI